MIGVERWAEIRKLYFVDKVGIRELARRTSLDRKTIRRALRCDTPPRYSRPPRPSLLDPYKPELHRLLREDGQIPGTRLQELIAAQGYLGGRTILGDYLREIRPLFAPRRTYQRTVYRPGEIGQFDLWQPAREIPVGWGQTRPGYVVVLALGYSRAGAGALVFSKEAPDILWGMTRCLWQLGGIPKTLVWDREGALHGGGGRPSAAFAAYCGELRAGWHLCQRGDAEAKGVVERLQGFIETSFEPARSFANDADFQLQLDRWFAERANPRHHCTLRCRPTDRLPEERAAMRPLPPQAPDVERRFALRVPPDPYLRVDTCDYSLDPRLVGRRLMVRVSQREVLAWELASGAVACHHERGFARHRTITDPAHRRLLEELRGVRPGGEPEVERRPLAVYDRLIPA